MKKTINYLIPLLIYTFLPTQAATKKAASQNSLAKGMATVSATLFSQIFKTQETTIVKNRKGETFTFYRDGTVAVAGPFGEDLGTHPTNALYPKPYQSISFEKQGNRTFVLVGGGLKGGCWKCQYDSCKTPDHCIHMSGSIENEENFWARAIQPGSACNILGNDESNITTQEIRDVTGSNKEDAIMLYYEQKRIEEQIARKKNQTYTERCPNHKASQNDDQKYDSDDDRSDHRSADPRDTMIMEMMKEIKEMKKKMEQMTLENQKKPLAVSSQPSSLLHNNRPQNDNSILSPLYGGNEPNTQEENFSFNVKPQTDKIRQSILDIANNDSQNDNNVANSLHGGNEPNTHEENANPYPSSYDEVAKMYNLFVPDTSSKSFLYYHGLNCNRSTNAVGSPSVIDLDDDFTHQ